MEERGGIVDDNLDNYVIFPAPLKTIGATFSSQTSENGSVEKKRLSIITLCERRFHRESI